MTTNQAQVHLGEARRLLRGALPVTNAQKKKVQWHLNAASKEMKD